MFVEHFLSTLRSRVEANFCDAVGLIARKRIMVLRHRSDDAVMRKFIEAINGKNNIDIGREPTTIEVDTVVAEF